MKMSFFKSSLLPLLLFILLGGIAYGQGCEERAYSSSLLFILKNKEVIEKTKRVFRSEARSSKNCLQLTVSGRIEYIPIYGFFSDYLSLSQIDNITKRGEGVSPKLYDMKNAFESYELSYLEKLLPENGSNLMIRFSKPMDGYILAEILDRRINFGKKRYGKSVQLLIIYDENYIVQNVHLSARLYN